METRGKDRREAGFARETEAAKLLLDQNWRDGLVGDNTYLRSLMILGYADRDARTELSLRVMEKNRRMRR